jgi:hypothetical protein
VVRIWRSAEVAGDPVARSAGSCGRRRLGPGGMRSAARAAVQRRQGVPPEVMG